MRATYGTFVAIAVAIPLAGSRAAEVPVLDKPIDCSVGKTCFIQNYVDIDSGPGARDFTCGSLTYDGHEGVDFRIRDLAEMAEGVPVLAAAPGRVLRIRDGVADGFPGEIGEEMIEGFECGNGVLIDHGGGWETQYCHLRKGSVAVNPEQEVEAGNRIALVGMSGNTQFPHLHLEVRHNGRVVDPYVGRLPAICTGEHRPLWSAAAQHELSYRPSGVLNVGFTSVKPTLRGIEEGGYGTHAPRKDTNLIFYVRLFGLHVGDRQRLRVLGPRDGVIVETTTMPAEKNKAQWMQFIGRRAPDQGWPSGIYEGRFELLRQGAVVLEATRQAEIP